MYALMATGGLALGPAIGGVVLATSPDAVWWGGALVAAVIGAGFLLSGDRIDQRTIPADSWAEGEVSYGRVNHHPFRMTLLIPSRERLRADVDEAFVVGAGALDEELLALGPAVEVTRELGVVIR